MPTFFNDGLDDTLAYDYVGNFAGGQASSVRANLLQDGQYSESRNMDIDKFGAIITRRGTEIIGSTLTNPIQGLVYMDTPSIEQLLAVSNGVVYKSTGSSWSSVSGYTPSASNNVEAVQFLIRFISPTLAERTSTPTMARPSLMRGYWWRPASW